jgi:predicted DNA-binding transcriptional regulator YafY
MRLQESLKQVINEIASLDSIINAIENRYRVVIYYDGDEPGGRGVREIEPVCLGVSKSGNKVLRAWDNEGASHTAYKGEQPLPSWRLFRLDKILSNKPTGEVYNEIRPGYNLNGDKSMVSIIINAKFGNEQEPQQPIQEPQQPQETETETTPTPTPTPQT